MASRSTLIKFQNETSVTLTLNYVTLQHGIWTDNMYPPQTIPPGGNASFQAESNGFMTGDQGAVQYLAGSEGIVELDFDNPFSGGNSYGGSAPKNYHLNWSGGGGNNATVVFTLTPASA